MKKKRSTTGIVRNKRATFDYELKDSFVAGIVLSGAEVKSLRMGSASLQGAFVNIKDGEAWLMNSTIIPIKTNAEHLPSDIQIRDRKLLLKKKELDQLIDAKNQGYTIVPVKILTKRHFIKIEISIARGKKRYDKRQSIKKRETDRNIQREMSA